MKAKHLLTVSLAVLMAIGMVTAGVAGSLESVNIFGRSEPTCQELLGGYSLRPNHPQPAGCGG